MQTSDSNKRSGLGTLVILGLMYLVGYIYVVGLHYQTGTGEHTGYVTAAEKTGIIFKTNTVYLKTDPQSSQEDAYCVVDSGLYSQLENLSRQKAQVTVNYISWLVSGVKNCNGEQAVITGISANSANGQKPLTIPDLFEGIGGTNPTEQTSPIQKSNNPFPGYVIRFNISSHDANVEKIQRQLNFLGSDLVVDGYFGNKTKQAVVTFQSANGLNQNGEVDQVTWDTLFSRTSVE